MNIFYEVYQYYMMVYNGMMKETEYPDFHINGDAKSVKSHILSTRLKRVSFNHQLESPCMSFVSTIWSR